MDTSSDSKIAPVRLFGRQKPIHAVLGGGIVGDVLLWRYPRVSAAILIGIAAIWFLFEVVEYNFVTFLCHLLITTMLIIFIWSSAAQFFKWSSPPKMMLQDSTMRDIASTFHKRFNDLLSQLLHIATGYDDPKLFLLILFSLWIISIIGSYVSSLNLLFFGLLCMGTLPFLYERYEDEVDTLAHKLNKRMKKSYKKF